MPFYKLKDWKVVYRYFSFKFTTLEYEIQLFYSCMSTCCADVVMWSQRTVYSLTELQRAPRSTKNNVYIVEYFRYLVLDRACAVMYVVSIRKNIQHFSVPGDVNIMTVVRLKTRTRRSVTCKCRCGWHV